MLISEYQVAARSTAVYPTRVVYPALGLGGEWGELGEKLFEANVLQIDDNDSIIKEIGDVLWYVSNLASDLEIELKDLLGYNNFSSIPDNNSYDPYLTGSGRVGRVLELIKKSIRDDNGFICNARREMIANGLKSLLEDIVALASCFNIHLEVVAERNIAKLKDRQVRGVLKGEGDNR